jgi:aryl-alcohol dehydrogenase-like predicted oxidoreductase
MRARPLGKSGILVSPLALGTVKFGRNQEVKYPAFEIPSDARCLELIDLAEARGINTIDTAPAYGESEDRIGRFLLGRRDRWIVCTKAGEDFQNGESRFDFSADGISSSIERSLCRLRTDRVDLLLLHSDGKVELDMNSDGTLDALLDVKRRGLARAVGVSAKSPQGALSALEALDAIMVTLHPQDRSFEEVIRTAQKKGVGVLVKKALASGRQPGALSFSLAMPGVSSVVVGTIDPAHLSENCDVADGLVAGKGSPSVDPQIPL